MNAYRVWAPKALGWARQECEARGRPDLAEDVTAEVWRRLWGHFDKVKHPSAYLRRAIARTAARMCQQERRREHGLARVMGGVE
jgi:DNA-directed RNA polymerase specialized sigma24 family protein